MVIADSGCTSSFGGKRFKMRRSSTYLPMMSHRSVPSVLRGAIRRTDHDFLRAFPFQYLKSPGAPRVSHARGDSPAFMLKKDKNTKLSLDYEKLLKFAPMLPGAAQLSRPVTNNPAIKLQVGSQTPGTTGFFFFNRKETWCWNRCPEQKPPHVAKIKM